MIRTRIAPSPTGLFHIGTARTALFNYLFAKKYGGQFILRIEDTDKERSKSEFEKDVFEGLKWLGIVPYEGPYYQSERTEIYKKYLEQLLNKGSAFYCFHSEKELADEKKWKMENQVPVLHICSYRDLSKQEAEKKRIAGEQAIIRFKIPRDTGNEQITFGDKIRGQVHFFVGLLGDFSMAKNLDEVLYNFAVVIDDYEMKITNIIRGEDHISNTPKQLLIAEALGWTTKNEIGDTSAPWEYAHLPLILGPDRSKLSKRHGAMSVSEYKALGYLPEAMINFMAFLGWNPGGEREFFSLAELEKEFSLENVQKAGAVFNLEKLDWFNAHYIKQKSVEELAELCKSYFETAKLPAPSSTFLHDVIALEQPRLKKLSDIVEHTRFFFELSEYDTRLLLWKGSSKEKTIQALETARTILEGMNELPEESKLQQIFYAKAEKLGGKGELLWPLRVALSGQKNSPGPFEIIVVLGAEESIRRIDYALKRLKAI